MTKEQEDLELETAIEQEGTIMPEPKKEWFGYSKRLDEMERGVWGSFAQHVAKAWCCADASNRKALVDAFPRQFPDTYRCYE